MIVKCCLMPSLCEIYIVLQLSVALNLFEGRGSVKHLKVKVTFFSKFLLIRLKFCMTNVIQIKLIMLF